MAIGVDKDEMLEYINKYNLNEEFTIYDITLIYLKKEDDEYGMAYEQYEVECRVEWTDPQSPKFRGALRRCFVNVKEYNSYIKRKHSITWI